VLELIANAEIPPTVLETYAKLPVGSIVTVSGAMPVAKGLPATAVSVPEAGSIVYAETLPGELPLPVDSLFRYANFPLGLIVTDTGPAPEANGLPVTVVNAPEVGFIEKAATLLPPMLGA
jgi:hypothetical protein